MRITRNPNAALSGATLAGLALVAACATTDASRDDTTAITTSSTPAVTAGTEPTAIEISHYELDMDKMRRYVTAIKKFSALAPSDTAKMVALNPGSNGSTAASIAALEAHPVAKRVLSEAGLTARDYVWITSAYLQAAMTQGLLQTSSEFKVPEGQSRQNLDFLNANKLELESMMKDAGMLQ